MMASIHRMARWSALLGGVMLTLLTLLVVLSVIGRSLSGMGLGPVPGDYELVEMGVGIAIFFFMPWCYLQGGHATVDLLYSFMSTTLQRFIRLLSDVLMLAIWLLLTWRLWEGLMDKLTNQETTFILQIPLWWGFAICMIGAILGCITYFGHILMQLGLAQDDESLHASGPIGH
jgi:TRAP-type C4-dicarboxylate transport system permease small subunit